MILNEEERRWQYLTVKILSALLTGITSKNNGDFYCLDYLHFLRAKRKLESHIKVCENKDSCNIFISPDDTKLLELIKIKNLIMHHLLFMQILNV